MIAWWIVISLKLDCDPSLSFLDSNATKITITNLLRVFSSDAPSLT